MTQTNSVAKVITSSPQEIRELKTYIRSLETQLHERNQEVSDLRAARSVRLAKAIRNLRRQPRMAVRDFVAALRLAQSHIEEAKLSHRHFAVFNRSPASLPSTHAPPPMATLLPQILGHCAQPHTVLLAGSSIPAEWRRSGVQVVTPHDFEIALVSALRPALMIDLDQVCVASPWWGIMQFDNMRLNQSFARLVDLVARLGGRTVIARASDPNRFPLVDDFSAVASIVEALPEFGSIATEAQL